MLRGDPAWWPGGDLLSRALGRSTMGAGVFHGRVRDGNGCVLPAMATWPPGRILRSECPDRLCGWRVRACAPVRGLVLHAVPLAGRRGGGGSELDREISTARLRRLPGFDLRPIDVVVSHVPQGRHRLEGGFPLRCLQRLSRPHLATRRCRWRDNRYTSGASIPVLSYWGRRLSGLQHPWQIGTELSHDVLNPAHVPL